MVLDAVMCHCVMVVATTEAGAEGLGAKIQDLAAYFYADIRLVTLTQPERLKGMLDVLIDLFDQVGFQTNMWKTVIMACQTFHTPDIISVVED